MFFGQNGQGKTNLLESAYYPTELRSFRTKHPDRDRSAGASRRPRLAAEVTSRRARPPHRRRDGAAPGASRCGSTARPCAAGAGPARVGRGRVRARGSAAAARAALRAAQLPRPRRLRRRPRCSTRRRWPTRRCSRAATPCSRRVPARVPRTPALLATYDEQLARTGARLVMRRRALVAALAPRVPELFVGAARRPAGGASGTAATRRRRRPARRPRCIAALAGGPERTRELDQRRRFTGFGPHTDDLEIDAGRASGARARLAGAAALAGAGAQAGRARPPRGGAGRAAVAAARRRGQRARREAPPACCSRPSPACRARRFITVDRPRPHPHAARPGRLRGVGRSDHSALTDDAPESLPIARCPPSDLWKTLRPFRAIRFTPRETDARYLEALGFLQGAVARLDAS